jgi:hypothetical protein
MRACRGLAFAGLAALASACAPGEPRDLLVERCSEVIQYRQPSLRDVAIVGVLRGPGTSSVTLDFEARAEPSGAPMSNRIACDFDPADRWSLERIRIGERALTEAEVALVNSEFLLRDLSRSPQRLGRAPLAGSVSDS